ncbi:hypothetical protein [Spirosoma radiotolerans]|nr:hypothetical protein [Spirosoma radiotolerans]
MNKNKIIIYFTFFLTLVSINFFQWRYLSEATIRAVNFTFSLIVVIISIPFFYKRSFAFNLPIQMICASILISIPLAYISWKQDIWLSVKSTMPYLIWFFYFFLIQKKIKIKIIEKITLFYGALYMILFLFQFINSDIVYFGTKSEFVVDRGITRIIFPGAGIFFLSLFISLCKLSYNKKNKIIWLTFISLGAVVTVLQVTRQSIVFLIFIYIYHFFSSSSNLKKLIILSISFCIIYIAVNSNHSIVRGLSETQKETQHQGSEYIRVLSAKYFILDFSPNLLSRILGNGIPYGDKSVLGREELKLQTVGYYLSDIGLVGLYAMCGIIPVLAYFIIFYKSFKVKVPKPFYYLKYYIWMVMFTSLTSDSVYADKFLIANIFVVYLYQYISEKNALYLLNLKKYRKSIKLIPNDGQP